MPKKLLKEVADYCWSNNFLTVFRTFFADHAEAFEGAPEMSAGEHNMEYYNLFQIYLKLYEDTLERYLTTIAVSIEDFYREVRDSQQEETDPYLQTFIDCLLASADYDSFYKVMHKQGLLSKARKGAFGHHTAPAASASAAVVADAKADCKAVAVGGAMASPPSDAKGDAGYKADSKDYK